MTDENPYRFSGEASPASVSVPDASLGRYVRPSGPPILSPGQIRRLAYDRGWFLIAFPLAVAWTFVDSYLLPESVVERLPLNPHTVREIVWSLSLAMHAPAAILAYRMQTFSNRSRLAAFILAALICVPLMKYLVAFFLLRDSRQILMRHGIRMGLLRVEHGSLPGRDAR